MEGAPALASNSFCLDFVQVALLLVMPGLTLLGSKYHSMHSIATAVPELCHGCMPAQLGKAFHFPLRYLARFEQYFSDAFEAVCSCLPPRCRAGFACPIIIADYSSQIRFLKQWGVIFGSES